jgi:membrane carboxypeptidase/penicillin-binding protein
VSVVWIGRDDNSPARLSGSRVALPIWARFTAAVGSDDGAEPWTAPAGVESAEIDPDTGALATPFCPHRRTDFFYTSRVPVFACPMHAMPGAEWAVRAAAPPAGDPSQTVIVLNAAGEGGSSWMVFQRKPPPAGGALPPASALPPGR